MKALGQARGLLSALRHLSRRQVQSGASETLPPRIGLALGGGFARGIAHAGVLNVLQQSGIPIHYITGVSAGSIVAAAFASGVSLDEIAATASCMRFSDVAQWSVSKMGLAKSRRMSAFLRRLLRQHRFELPQILSENIRRFLDLQRQRGVQDVR